MEPAPLLSRAVESQDNLQTQLVVLVAENGEETCITARAGLVAEAVLTSIHEEEEEFDLIRATYTRSWLTRDNPFLPADTLERLDEHGVILVGATLKADDVLASSVGLALPGKRRRTRPGHEWVTHNSWEAPTAWQGATVTKVELLARRQLGKETPREVHQRVRVAVRAEHPLAIGDVLLFQSHVVGVVGRLVSDADMPTAPDGRRVDLIVPRRAGQLLGLPAGQIMQVPVGKAASVAARSVQGRSMEIYSLISNQPLHRSPNPGQLVSASHTRWLASRGFAENVAELTSLKSDDLRSRGVLQKLAEAESIPPETVPEPGAPESLLMFRQYLMGLGIAATLDEEEGAVAVSVRPASDDDILSWSSGQVRRPETIHWKTLEEFEEGLFCPRIFGPVSHMRRRRFGHLALPCPVVSPLWRQGNPSPLEKLLEISAEQIAKLLANQIWLRREGKDWKLIPGTKDQEPESGSLSGAAAIEVMLQAAPPDRLPAGLQGQAHILVRRLVPVIPPQFRPLVLLDNGAFATADVNDLYRQLINRANRLSKLEELKAPTVIVLNERRELQRLFDALEANCLLRDVDALLGESSDKRLVDCLNLVAGHIRQGEKLVDWCGKARAVVLDAASERQILVPRPIFTILKLDPSRPVLVTTPDSGDGAFVSLLPQPHDEAVFGLPRAAWARLASTTPVPVCVLHRPLGAGACGEAELLLQGDPGPRCHVPETDGWTDAADLNSFTLQLVDAALSGARLVLQSPRGLLIGGPGKTDFAEDSELPLRDEAVQEVPRPPEEAPLRGEGLQSRMFEVLEACKRKACIFQLARTRKELALGEGRVGGLPDLPADVAWPENREGPLPFLAQLPLDAARQAGILPIEAPPGALLTVFEAWENQGVTPPGPVFLCGGNDRIERRPAPPEVEIHPWCKIRSRIVEEVPSWEEAVDILTAELGEIDPKELARFHQSAGWNGLPRPRETIKIGGWPAWIQAPEHQGPLLAQIISNEKAEMTFFDEGTLFVFVSAPGRFDSLVQFS